MEKKKTFERKKNPVHKPLSLLSLSLCDLSLCYFQLPSKFPGISSLFLSSRVHGNAHSRALSTNLERETARKGASASALFSFGRTAMFFSRRAHRAKGRA